MSSNLSRIAMDRNRRPNARITVQLVMGDLDTWG